MGPESNHRPAPDDETLLPHSREAEAAVIGSVLKDPTTITETGALVPEDFTDPRYREIFRAMTAVAKNGEGPDIVEIASHLKAGRFDVADVLDYLAQVRLETVTAAHIARYAAIVRRTAAQRGVIAAAQTIAEIAYRDNVEPEATLKRANQLLNAVAERYGARATAPGELPFIMLCDLLASTPPEPTWAIPRLCAVGAVTDLVGKVKTAGKTTLLAAGARAAITGGTFLGQRAPRAPVVYLTEQPDTSLAEELVAAGLQDLDDHSDLLFVRRRDVLGLSWPDIVAKSAQLAERVGARAMVIDTILAFAGLSAEQAENDAAAAQQAMGPVLDVVSQGRFGVTVSRHEGKGPEREIGEAGRGSSAWAGAADQLCVLRRPDGRQRSTIRQLDTLSRFQGLEPTAMIEWLGSDGYGYVGSDTQVQLSAARAVLCEFAPSSSEQALQIDAMLKLVPAPRRPARATAYRAAEELVEDGDFHRRGDGKRGSPRRFWRPS